MPHGWRHFTEWWDIMRGCGIDRTWVSWSFELLGIVVFLVFVVFWYLRDFAFVIFQNDSQKAISISNLMSKGICIFAAGTGCLGATKLVRPRDKLIFSTYNPSDWSTETKPKLTKTRRVAFLTPTPLAWQLQQKSSNHLSWKKPQNVF